VPSWKQIGIDVGGAALGNAAAAGLSALGVKPVNINQLVADAFKNSAPTPTQPATTLGVKGVGYLSGFGDSNGIQGAPAPTGFSADDGTYAGINDGTTLPNNYHLAPAGSGSSTTSPTYLAAPDVSPGVTGRYVSGYSVYDLADLTDGSPTAAQNLNEEHAHSVAYHDYYNQQNPDNPLPSVPGIDNPSGLATWNDNVQHMLLDAAATAAPHTTVVAGTSELAQDQQAGEVARDDAQKLADSIPRNNFEDDLDVNALLVANRGLISIGTAVLSAYDIAVDSQSRANFVVGSAHALIHPITTYDNLVDQTSHWYEKPLAEQAQSLGDVGVQTLVGGELQASVEATVAARSASGISPVTRTVEKLAPSADVPPQISLAASQAPDGLLVNATGGTGALALRGEVAGVVSGDIVPDTTAIDASISSGNSLASNVYHVTTNPYAAPSILDNGIDPAFLNPNARFGAAFYVAEQPTAALAELAHYKAEPFMAINFSTNSGAANVLDLTNLDIASAWGYDGGPITPATQSIGSQASAQGYNVIKYYSERAPGMANYAILKNYNEVLTPYAISPAKP